MCPHLVTGKYSFSGNSMIATHDMLSLPDVHIKPAHCDRQPPKESSYAQAGLDFEPVSHKVPPMLNSTELFFLQLSPHEGLHRFTGGESFIEYAVHGAGHGHVHAEALRQPVHGLRGLDPFGHHAHG